MAEPLQTAVDGVEIEVPNSIFALRAALPERRREEFDREINSAGVHEIHAVMRHWMFEAVPDPAADAIMAGSPVRKRRGKAARDLPHRVCAARRRHLEDGRGTFETHQRLRRRQFYL